MPLFVAMDGPDLLVWSGLRIGGYLNARPADVVAKISPNDSGIWQPALKLITGQMYELPFGRILTMYCLLSLRSGQQFTPESFQNLNYGTHGFSS